LDVNETSHELVDALKRLISHTCCEKISGHNLATKHDLKEMEEKIMSAITVFADRQNAFNDRVDAAVTGLVGDVKSLKDQITVLQNSPGGITPEDQIILDQIESRSAQIASKLEALDALTPPVVPTA